MLFETIFTDAFTQFIAAIFNAIFGGLLTVIGIGA